MGKGGEGGEVFSRVQKSKKELNSWRSEDHLALHVEGKKSQAG